MLRSLVARWAPSARRRHRLYEVDAARPQVAWLDPATVAGRHVVFHHICQTGGSAFNFPLFNSELRHARVQADVASAEQARAVYATIAKKSRRRPLLISGHWTHGVEEHLNGPWLKFTLMRDPVERFVSEFFWINRNAAGIGYPWDLLPLLERMVADYECAGHANVYCYEYATPLCGRPHVYVHGSPLNMARTDPGALHAKAEALLSSDYFLVGVTEMFEETLYALFALLGLPRIKMWFNPPHLYAAHRGENTRKFGRRDLPVRLLKRIEALTEADQDLYDRHRAMFERRFADFRFGEGFRAYKRTAYGIVPAG